MLYRFIKFFLALCPLLLALSSVPACKKPTEPKTVLPDTTSHNFVFEIDTLGNGSSSVLNDVWIFDENNIWAVGEIYVQDSTGQSEEVYNAVHWDGKQWNLKKVPVRDLGGFTFLTPLKAVIGFSPNDVWVAGDADLIRWNGSSWSGKALFIRDLSFNGQVLKMWGTNGSNIYCVGRNGAIYHYNGSTWQKLASGTTVDIQDIWGAVDEKTKQPTILAVASLLDYGRALALLKIDGTSVTMLDSSGLHVSESSLWFQPSKVFFVTGNGVYKKAKLEDSSWQINHEGHPLLYKYRIRGNAWNDVFIAGSGGLLSHYNGSTWKHYTGMELPRAYSFFNGLAVKSSLVVAVGWFGEKAGIVRGLRR